MMVYLALLLAGIASGFMAGLLGIGGGFVMVPVLILLLPMLGIDPGLVPKVAVATSLAAMVPTACSAVFAQYRRGALDIQWVRRLTPAAAIGAVIGSQVAAAVNGRWVAMVFVIYTACIALKMARATDANVRAAHIADAFPAPLVGGVIGTFASMAGVGGASLTVPYLLSARVEMKRALAVSSAVGLAIALAGGAGFAIASFPVSTGSPELIGFIHWPAALMIALSATLLAPGGVCAAHMLPVVHLKRAFAAVLVAACTTTLTKAANTTGLVDYAAASPATAAASRN
jgi:uncharacterized membrane protein YfcA